VEQWHEVGSQALNGPCSREPHEPRELDGCAEVIERERIIGASHPFPRRLIIAPRNCVAKDNFHCTRRCKLLPGDLAQNPGLDDKGFKYFAGDAVGESTTARAKNPGGKKCRESAVIVRRRSKTLSSPAWRCHRHGP
jgi:hypothetical protein